MIRKKIETALAPAAIGTYSQAWRAGDFVFTSGQIPLVPGTGHLIRGDFRAAVRQVLQNLDAILVAERSGILHAIKLTVYILDFEKFAELNEVFMEFFPENPPARSTVQVSRLPKDADVEIDCVAIVPGT